ncbi:MAG: phosphotransferase [Cyclobacteriaceae bacterium]
MATLQEKFRQHYPNMLYLSQDDPETLTAYLQHQQWIKVDEPVVSLEKPGEGNMNVVVRVITDQQTFIVKQARPWVQKYPQVEAPMQRSEVEAVFYELIADNSVLRARTPKLIGVDAANFIIALEDMGSGSDYTHLYQADQFITSNEITALTDFIAQLHRIRSDQPSVKFPSNQAMKELNHEHIFRFPFMEENGFNLDDVQPGLQEVSLIYKQHDALKQQVNRLGERYLAIGTTLLHGDYYPGSWLKTKAGITVIDPEFAFLGDPEFDLGVMMAHLTLARTEPPLIRQVLEQYKRPDSYNDSLQQAYSGVEILRRLIGLAQLPLSLSLDEKKKLLTHATKWVLQYQGT